jgi:hypothetical protein
VLVWVAGSDRRDFAHQRGAKPGSVGFRPLDRTWRVLCDAQLINALALKLNSVSKPGVNGKRPVPIRHRDVSVVLHVLRHHLVTNEK